MYPFPSFDEVMNSLRQIPMPWLGKLLSGQGRQLPIPREVTEGAERLVTSEKIVARIAAGGHKIYFLPLVDNYTEETEAMRTAYRVMLREPVIKAALLTKILGVAHLDLQVQPASDRSIDRIAADFCKEMIQKTKGGTRQLAMNVLLGGLLDGFSVTEKWMKISERGRWKGYHVPNKLKGKDTKNLRLLGDDFRNVTAIQDIRTSKEFHPGNFILYTHLPLFESPTGMSDLRAAYRAFWLMDTAWHLRAIGLERFSNPMLVGTFSHADFKADLETAMENARSQTWMSLPEGSRVQALELANRGQSDFQAAINDLREEIVIGINGAMLQMLAGDVSNGAGNSQVHKSTSELLQWMLSAQLGDVLTDQLVTDLVDFNFADADYPIVSFGGVNDANLASSLQIDSGLLQMGIDLSMDEVYKRYNRQKPRNQQDLLQSPVNYQKQQQEQQQQMQMQQMAAGQAPGGPGQQPPGQPPGSDNPEGDAGLEPAPGDRPDDGGTPGNQATDQREQGQQFSEKRRFRLVRKFSPLNPQAPKAPESASPIPKTPTAPEAPKAPGIPSTPKVGGAPNPVKHPLQWAAHKYKQLAGSYGAAGVAGKILGHAAASVIGGAMLFSPIHDTAGLVSGGITEGINHIQHAWHKVVGKHAEQFAEGEAGSPQFTDQMLDRMVRDARVLMVELHLAHKQPVPVISNAALKEHLKKFMQEPDKFSQGASSVSILTPQPRTEFVDDFTFNPGLGEDLRVPAKLKQTPGRFAEWEEDQHPRGNPKNKGEFVKKGLQAFYEDPISFAKKDPDYCKFVLKVLNGDAAKEAAANGKGIKYKIRRHVLGYSEEAAKPEESPNHIRLKRTPPPRVWYRIRKEAKPFAEESPNQVQPPSEGEVAGPHADAEAAQKLLTAAQQKGAQVLAQITRAAVKRLYDTGKTPTQARRLYSDEERQKLADVFAQVKGTAHLLGQAKTYLQFDKASEQADKFAESQPTDFNRFVDGDGHSTIQPMKPERAVAYFKGLVPRLNVEPGRFGKAMQRDAFTLAKATDMAVLQQIKDAIAKTLETGEGAGGAYAGTGTVGSINNILDTAGVSRRNPQYAEQVFRTNTLDAYSTGTIQALQDPDVEDMFPAYRFAGIHDGRQRKAHEAQFGKLFSTSVPFAEVRDAVKGEFDGFNCRCLLPGTVVQGSARAALKSFYSGKIIELRTKMGVRLTVTVNHPILTESGFVAAGQLNEGDYLVGYFRKDGLRFVETDKQDSPSTIEQVFDSLQQFGAQTFRKAASIFDFHGDGKFLNGDVEISCLDRMLLPNLYASGAKVIGDQVFLGSYRNHPLLSGHGPDGHGLGPVCRGDLSGSLSDGHSGPLDEFGSRVATDSNIVGHEYFPDELPGHGGCLVQPVGRLASGISGYDRRHGNRDLGCGAANWNSHIDQPASHRLRVDANFDGEGIDGFSREIPGSDGDDVGNVSEVRTPPSSLRFGNAPDFGVFQQSVSGLPNTDSELCGDLLSRFPGLIRLDQIVNIHVFDYSGPVYDLVSTSGYYIAQTDAQQGGVLVSNCTPVPISKMALRRMQNPVILEDADVDNARKYVEMHG